ncbi:MAG: glycoside hydrolase family 18 protein [Muribaculaceae bacterium]
MKRFLLLALVVAAACATAWYVTQPKDDRVVVAYVFRTDVPVDPSLMTHINYAFGHVTESFDSVRISNPDAFRQIVDLKKQNSKLKVLLSIGGWGSGNFSEMAANDSLRGKFAQVCRSIVDEYGIDGIDIDWEYPTVDAAGISASPDDTNNFTLLMRDLRNVLGKNLLLTLATPASAKHFDFPAILPYVDFVNIMAYDMAVVPNHHAAMQSADSTMMTVERAVDAHLQAGVPADRLVLGLPFYGKGTLKKPRESSIDKVKADSALTEQWNEEGQYAFLTDSVGTVVYTFDNVRSLAAKCRYANERKLRGAMYWEASCDDDAHSFARTVWNEIVGDQR